MNYLKLNIQLFSSESFTYAFKHDDQIYTLGGVDSSGDTLPMGRELDFDGDAQDIPVGWEQVDNPEAILTTEVKTNKIWKNGKPIYRLHLVGNRIWTETTSVSVPASANLEEITWYFIRWNNGNAGCKPIPQWESSAVYSTLGVSSNGTFSVGGTQSGYVAGEFLVTVEYTKTTDTATIT